MRITFDPNVMGGKPCIRGMRVTVETIVGLVASGYSSADILQAYPYLEAEDIREVLAYDLRENAHHASCQSRRYRGNGLMGNLVA